MLNLDLKQAEVAIAAGRLDEAFSLVRKQENRATRRGQELLTQLAEALIGRGREHLAAGRLAPAGSDAAKAIQCAGQKPDAVELFDAVAHARQTHSRQLEHQNQVVAEAERRAAGGEASLAGNIVQMADVPTTIARQFSERLEIKRHVATAALTKAEELIEQGHYRLALESLQAMLSEAAAGPQLAGLIEQALAPVIEQTQEDLVSGRLDRANGSVALLRPFAGRSSAARELGAALQHCCQLRGQLDGRDFAAARREVALIAQLLPEATWLQQVRQAIDKASEAIGDLEQSPLGLLTGPGAGPLISPPQTKGQAAGFVSPIAPGASWLPNRMLLQIDSLGSILVVLNDTITIASRSHGSSIDVPIASGDQIGPITVEREEDDYLLNCSQKVPINGDPVRKRLLQDGDKINIGRRGHLEFRRPVLASTSASLVSHGVPLSRSDVRQIIMLGDSLVVGTGASAHVTLREGSASGLIFRSEGGLAFRNLSTGVTTPISMGQSIELDEHRIKLAEVTDGNV